jgi:hypothetical protein
MIAGGHAMKRIPSNRMPKYVEPKCSPLGYLFLAAFLGGLGYAAWTVPWYVSVGIVTVVAVWVRIEHLRDKRIAAERAGESLCDFARSFDYRSTDTWIIRAVYEQFIDDMGFPPRKTDRFAVLGLDEDWDVIAEEVAQRTGRPLTNCEQNPLYDKVETVGDMVEFFMSQPKQAAI